ncbi:MAG: Gmad2 immunoglobulin-like domain-containing protein [Microthrixaceae bacterium]
MVVLVGALVLIGCGSDDDDSADTTSTTAPSETTTTDGTTTTNGLVRLEQPAIWPAPEVVFTTPEAAAEDFVSKVLGVPPALGEFQQGDSRSGEIEVRSLGEGANATPVVRSVLLLRQLGPDDGWFILAAVNDHETITEPEPRSEVAAGSINVAGVGRGFEANVVVRAIVAGDASNQLDQVITQGGSTETSEPYSVTLDLSGAAPGATVMLIVRGGVGLETDPGDFGAIPVVIAG